MAKTDLIHIRVSPETKKASEKIFRQLGINTSYAVSLFLNQVILQEGLPFFVQIPKAEVKSKAEKIAFSIEATGGNGTVSAKNQRILHLYANGDIDYETALFAIKKSF